MGFFSSSYVTTVGTTVSRAIQDSLIVPASKTGLVSALFSKDEGQLVEHILENMSTSMGRRAEKMHSYAKTKYTQGLPESKVSLSSDGQQAVIQLLKSITNPNITVDYYHFGVFNNLHAGWKKLVDTYNYNSITNELSALSLVKDKPVYLKDMTVAVKEATVQERANGSLDLWGTAASSGYTPERKHVNADTKKIKAPTPFRVMPELQNDSILLTYVWENVVNLVITPETTKLVDGVNVVVPAVTFTKNEILEEEIVISLAEFDTTKDYFQIKYIDEGKDKYWTYELGKGTYPTLDSFFKVTPNNLGEFFPITYLRYENKSSDLNKTEANYVTSTKMLQAIGMDYQKLIDGVNANPDINKVEQALLMFAVPPNSQNPVELKYLYDFFNKLLTASGGIGVGGGWDISDVGTGITYDGEYSYATSAAELAINKLQALKDTPSIQVTIQDKRFKTGLSCQGIFKSKKSGVIGAVNSYSSSFITENITYQYLTKVPGTEMVGDTVVYVDQINTINQPVDSYVYKYQVTENTYEQIQVYDLKMTYYIFEKYSTVGDNLDPILLIPIDRAITKTYSLSEKETLYSRALHYVFNSKTVTEVKWYQKPAFGTFIKIVGIILTVASLGADGGLFANLAAAIAVGAEAVTVFVLSALLDYVVLNIGFQLFVKAVGQDVALLVAIAAIAYGGYKAFEAGSIKGAPWASELLQLGNGLSAAVTGSVADAMQGLRKEYDEFKLFVDEQTKLLDDATKLLDNQTLLSPFVVFGESPDDFYNRTVHSGNIGIMGIDSIASFVDIALTLPKLNETLEGKSYV